MSIMSRALKGGGGWLGSFNFLLPFQSSGTMPGHKLTRAADTLIILSITVVASSWEPPGLEIKKSIGRIPDNIEYFRLWRPITLSTWMRTFAIPLVFSTSTGSSWSFPFVKAGMASCACWNITLSAMVKPRSAKTRSPGNNLFKIPQFSVKYLSDVRPPQA